MVASSNTYVPALKWRQGEYQALLELTDSIKETVVPLLILPEPEFDFETNARVRTREEQCELFVRRYPQKWGDRPAWLDFEAPMVQGTLSDGLFAPESVFAALSGNGGGLIPVVTFQRTGPLLFAIQRAVASQNTGVGIRVSLAELCDPDFTLNIQTLAERLKTNFSDIDLLIDLRTPDFEPYAVFASIVSSTLSRITLVPHFRSLVLIASSFPESLAGIKKPHGAIERSEWIFYSSHLVPNIGQVRLPSFGDYTIVNPEFSAAGDMRLIKPPAKVVYTDDTHWQVHKGGAFRDNPSQMRGLCSNIVIKPYFSGPTYSEGDRRIHEVANNRNNTGTLTTWKKVAINRHMTKVSCDLASLLGRPLQP